ncbi:tmm [Mytilus edulis]|uniref:Flavin-containing monooxygenase n=1 Tax=Mytilus edulis TaxID=6550 RepID=A0A8S3U166_MYTED|nr:tmm [Mytilus edulis]
MYNPSKTPSHKQLFIFFAVLGTDEYGEPCHGGMYKHLWSNGPKEGLEYPDYTFTEHFGKSVPSFLPRPVIRDYPSRLVKKSKSDLKQFIKWNTSVRYVRYNKQSDDFTVTTEDLKTGHTSDSNFTHVIVAVGIFNSPEKPYFVGIETFPGRIIHSHDFRDATKFKGQRVLVVGAKYITDTLPNKLKSCEEMKKEAQKWVQRCNQDIHEQIDFQADFIKDLSDGTEYSSDAPKANTFFHKWDNDKRANIVTRPAI